MQMIALNESGPGQSGAGETASRVGFLNEKQLLEKVPVSRRTLFSWRAQNKIPWIQMGGRVLFDWESVRNALLRQQRNGGAA